MDFTDLIDLASERLGGAVLVAAKTEKAGVQGARFQIEKVYSYRPNLIAMFHPFLGFPTLCPLYLFEA